MPNNILTCFVVLFLFFSCSTVKKSTVDLKKTNKTEVIKIAIGGDWDDEWGADGATTLSLKTGATHDLILMLGDLSYDGIDNDFDYNIKNAENWATKANNTVGNTPMLFVAGDHDSKNQDGDILTYAEWLNFPNGKKSVSPPTGKLEEHNFQSFFYISTNQF